MKRLVSRLFFILFFWILFCPTTLAEEFILDTSKSSVTFHGSSPLHRFSGASREVSGFLQTEMVENQLLPKGRVTLSIDSLQTGIQGRDHAVQYTLRAKEFPMMVFEPKEWRWTGERYTDSGRTGLLKGELSIGGKSRSVEIPCLVWITENSAKVTGNVSLTLSMFGLETPGIARLLRVSNDVKVDFEAFWKKRA